MKLMYTSNPLNPKNGLRIYEDADLNVRVEYNDDLVGTGVRDKFMKFSGTFYGHEIKNVGVDDIKKYDGYLPQYMYGAIASVFINWINTLSVLPTLEKKGYACSVNNDEIIVSYGGKEIGWIRAKQHAYGFGKEQVGFRIHGKNGSEDPHYGMIKKIEEFRIAGEKPAVGFFYLRDTATGEIYKEYDYRNRTLVFSQKGYKGAKKFKRVSDPKIHCNMLLGNFDIPYHPVKGWPERVNHAPEFLSNYNPTTLNDLPRLEIVERMPDESETVVVSADDLRASLERVIRMKPLLSKYGSAVKDILSEVEKVGVDQFPVVVGFPESAAKIKKLLADHSIDKKNYKIKKAADPYGDLEDETCAVAFRNDYDATMLALVSDTYVVIDTANVTELEKKREEAA